MDTKTRARIKRLISAINNPFTYVAVIWFAASFLPKSIQLWIQIPLAVFYFVLLSHQTVELAKMLWKCVRRRFYRKEINLWMKETEFWKTQYFDACRSYLENSDHFDPEVRALAQQRVKLTVDRLMETLTKDPTKK